jgi:hypothetical protein
MRRLILAVILLSCCSLAQQPSKDKWADWQRFLGTWEGTGSGAPGQGSGSFSFTPDLQGAVLVRHNYAQYPATKDEPSYRHDDLMVIYPDGNKTRADYWDNEAHVIHYWVEFTDGARKLVMTSDASQPGPHYRLTYLKTGDNDLKLTFEIAPTDAPDKFKTYIEAAARRTAK